jgi:hypothetical protein
LAEDGQKRASIASVNVMLQKKAGRIKRSQQPQNPKQPDIPQ